MAIKIFPDNDLPTGCAVEDCNCDDHNESLIRLEDGTQVCEGHVSTCTTRCEGCNDKYLTWNLHQGTIGSEYENDCMIERGLFCSNCLEIAIEQGDFVYSPIQARA